MIRFLKISSALFYRSIGICFCVFSLTTGSIAQQRLNLHEVEAQSGWKSIWRVDDEEEDEERDPYKGFSIGLNVGSYFASQKTGNFYNGSCPVSLGENPNEVRCFTIGERLNLTPQEFNYITTYYNATSFEVPRDSYPLRMRYNPAFMVGMQIKYNFNRDNALILNVNSMRLKAVDVFTLRFIGTPMQQNAQQDIRIFQITGSEQRFNFSLGYRMGAEINHMTNWYFQPGASMLGTRFDRNEIFVAERSYELFIGAANPQQVLPYQPRTDIGFGYYLATGFEFWIKDKYSFDISFGFSRDKVILINLEEKVWNKWIQASFTI